MRTLVAIALLLAVNLFLASRYRDPVVNVDPRAEVRERVQTVDLTEADRKWESIGWVTDMGLALELSHRLGRPIFILGGAGTLDGRC